FVVADHVTLKLRRAGRRARTIQSSGFRLPDDLLGIDRGGVVIVFSPGRLLTGIDVLVDRPRTRGGARSLGTAALFDPLGGSGRVALNAPHSPTGLTGDAATAMVVADALIQGVAALDVETTVESSHTLTTLRQQLGF